jgi:phospholipid/cholesterol/gamma-HCH transport system ATP-binding protein
MSTSDQRGVRVAARNVRKTFDQRPVLDGISLTVESGEVFVMMGASGSGKSVFLRHLIGLEHPDEGDIEINGHPVLSSEAAQKFRLAMVFQSGALLNSLTVGENVGLYLSEHRLCSASEIQRIVAEKLELVGLQGLESRNVSELSGGMKKRVAIARALVMEPQLLLYDEPTSELDPLIALTIAEEIADLNERTGVTSIIVTHDRDLAFGIADRIGFLADGKIAAVGTVGEIRESPNPSVQKFLAAKFINPRTTHEKLS